MTAMNGTVDLATDLRFKGSREATVGIELELPILDRDTGDLVPGAPRLLAACQEEGVKGIAAELMQSMIEVKTDVCPTAMEAKKQLRARLGKLHNIARSLGYDLALWGTHPFARPSIHSLTHDERMVGVERRLAWMMSQRVTFGLHIHVGVRSGDEAVGLINMLVQYLPHMLALSANSPFWQGVDTGMASTRAVLYNLVPRSGIPSHFENWKDLREYIEIMREGGLLRTHKDLKWEIRPRPDFGTIEFRICDTPDRLGVVGGLAALARSLVISTQRLLEDRPQLCRGDERRQWFAVENRSLAARYGPEAVYIRTARGKRRYLRQELEDLIERLAPVAREGGDEGLLNELISVLRGETGAARQRRIKRDSGDWSALVKDAVQRLDAALRPTKRAA